VRFKHDHENQRELIVDPARRADNLQQDIQSIRGNLGDLIHELDYRRRRAMDFRGHVRRHPVPVIVGAVAAVGMIVGAFALAANRRRNRRTRRARWHGLREAVQRMMEHPERVAKEGPNVGLKILAAGGTTAASLLVKRLALRLLDAGK
jgi:hypothetical protein